MPLSCCFNQAESLLHRFTVCDEAIGVCDTSCVLGFYLSLCARAGWVRDCIVIFTRKLRALQDGKM